MKKITLLSLAACFIAHTAWSAPKEIYVTQEKLPGKTTYKTLQQGVNAAGKLKQKGEEVILFIAGGVYTLDKTLEMTAKELGSGDTPMTMQAMPGETVTMIGGKTIPLSLLKEAPADERVRPEVRSKIRFIDLKEAGITDFGKIYHSGGSRPSMPSWSEVFVNDQVQKISRWPNDTMALMGKVLVPGSIPRWGDMENIGGTFMYYGDRPSDWKETPKWICGYFAHGYTYDMLNIASMDTKEKTFTMAEAYTYGLISGADFNRYFILNMLEEVDAPGEYYIDEEKGQIWIYPSTDEIRDIKISLLDAPIVALEGVKNVEVKGINFECSRGIGLYMERTDHVIVRGCEFHNLGHLAVCIGRGVQLFKDFRVVEPDAKPWSRYLGNFHQYIFAHSDYNRQGGTNNGVVDCIISEVGSGGVSLGGGDKRTLTPANNYVENCRISNFNRIERTYRPGVDISGVGNRVSHCEIFNAPAQAILMRGNDHLVEYNEIYKVCDEIDDMGAIYYGRNPSEQGIRIMYNYIHHLSDKHRVTGIYHDDGACGMLSFGNVLYKAGMHPFLVGGGSDNRIENNMIIDSYYGIYVDDRLENWCDTPYIDSVYHAYFDQADYTSDIFKERYPLAANYFNEGYKHAKRNVALKNLFYNVDELIRQGERDYEDGHIEMYNNYITMRKKGFGDPGFVDEANENWNLKPDAKTLQVICDFLPIPFDQIGCTLPKK